MLAATRYLQSVTIIKGCQPKQGRVIVTHLSVREIHFHYRTGLPALQNYVLLGIDFIISSQQQTVEICKVLSLRV